jgi:hypothetical protein
MRGPIPRARGPVVLSVPHGPAPLLRSELLRSPAFGRSRARGLRLRVQGGGGGVGEAAPVEGGERRRRRLRDIRSRAEEVVGGA